MRVIDDTLFVRINDIHIEIDMKIVFRVQNLRILIVERLILIVLKWNINNHERFAINLRTSDACHCVANATRLRRKHDSEMWRKKCMKHLNNRCILNLQIW
jgi:hypothetical protein